MKRLFGILIILFSSCKSEIDYLTEDYKSENGHYRAVIEIPSGTNLKVEFNKVDKVFKPDIRDGKERSINFLPYPGNYGFIPSTYSDPEKGGDGDPLDVIILSSALKSGDIIEFIPVAMLKLIDEGEKDYKIVGIPADEKDRILNTSDFATFNSKYSAAKEILELWFTSYDPGNDTRIEGWGSEKEATEEIEKWHQNF